jgi:moderate conductance mechanosensitive channel
MDLLTIIPLEILRKIINLLVIILISTAIIKLISFSRARLEQRPVKFTRSEEQKHQYHTLLMVGEYILRIIVIFLAAVWILALFGVNIAPILATVGVTGLAVTLGAQTIIKDYIGGVIILVENLYYLGDTVTIGTNTGVVERITLRSTYLRDAENKLVIIPNGDIRTLVLDNRSSQETKKE